MTGPLSISPTIVTPEDHVNFRLGQLLLLLWTLRETDNAGAHLERLGYYDFFAANPHLLINAQDPERSRLLMDGFDPSALSYASPGQLFSSRRERLQHDLALLVGYGLAVVRREPGRVAYNIIEPGQQIASQFTALYARAYVTSARTVIRKLSKLSDSRLRAEARDWLRAPDALLDLIDRAPSEATIDDR